MYGYRKWEPNMNPNSYSMTLSAAIYILQSLPSKHLWDAKFDLDQNIESHSQFHFQARP